MDRAAFAKAEGEMQTDTYTHPWHSLAPLPPFQQGCVFDGQSDSKMT